MDASQAAGIAPEKCAARILAGLDRRKDEIVVGGKERATCSYPLLPAVFRRAIRIFKVT